MNTTSTLSPSVIIGDIPCPVCGNMFCNCILISPKPLPSPPVPQIQLTPPLPFPDLSAAQLAEVIRLAGENALLKKQVEELEEKLRLMKEKFELLTAASSER